MTSAAPALLDTSARPRAPAPARGFLEFLVVGGATLFLLPASWLLRGLIGLDSAELAVGFVMFHAAHFINDPHFAVTYVLFYRDVRRRAWGSNVALAQRVRYLCAGVAVPLALAAMLVVALSSHSSELMGALIQVMFFLVGWHYVKQGFGALSVLSARRGVRFTPFERRALLLHCFTGWAYAWCSPASAATEAEEKGVVYSSLAHPRLLERMTGVSLALSALGLALVLFRKWQRERRLPPLSPLLGFLVSIWVWTIYSSADPLLVYVIPALHSLQYLYFVWLLTHNQAKHLERPPFFGPSARQRLLLLGLSALALGWVLFHGAPELLDGARLATHRHARIPLGDLGPTPYFAAIFTFVNIHHYFMDHVIWRRENADTRYLQDPPPTP